MTIGFDPEEYVVSENDGSVTLMVRHINGVLEREVIVNFNTESVSATSTINFIPNYYVPVMRIHNHII